MPNRAVIEQQVHPGVAACITRVDGWGWLIVTNDRLSRAGRDAIEIEAHQYIDAFLMGWSYALPEGGVDVPFRESVAYLAAVDDGAHEALRERLGRLSVGALLPLTGCAVMLAEQFSAAGATATIGG